jgi:hypothetical protein
VAPQRGERSAGCVVIDMDGTKQSGGGDIEHVATKAAYRLPLAVSMIDAASTAGRSW